MNEKTKFGLHWFRRDLRVSQNLSLQYNLKENNGRVLALFCFDSAFLSRDDFSHNRFAFFLKTLLALKSELNSLGGDLLVVDSRPQDAFSELFYYFKEKNKTELPLVTWSRDYEPFARSRDEEIKKIIKSHGASYFTERDHLIIEPHELLKNDGAFYQIFTPFSRKWREIISSSSFLTRIDARQKNIHFSLKWSAFKNEFPFADKLDEFILKNSKNVTVPIPEAGSKVALQHLKKFKKKLDDYKHDRDIPAIAGTSRFSLYLKNGSLTTSQIINDLELLKTNFNTETGKSRFLKELIWREFYYSILYHCPRAEREAFNLRYVNLKWPNNEQWFSRWCEGTTGFPIVDAGMRELNSTGWMHNRVRMIVASFLTKDLLIDWRWGEKYFMQKLLDGDLAPNNGGWQWAASTGCDPQPYFRIFNPTLQSKRFDPENKYIRRFVPEFDDISKYPTPLVDHSVQKEKALALYIQTASVYTKQPLYKNQ